MRIYNLICLSLIACSSSSNGPMNDPMNGPTTQMSSSGQTNNPSSQKVKPGKGGLISLSPSLGDTSGNVKLYLTVNNSKGINSITVGSSSCKPISIIDSTHMSCLVPAQKPGKYDVQFSRNGVKSNALLQAYEAWSPIVDYPMARLFQSDQGTVQSGMAHRGRASVINDPLLPGYIDRDGAGIVQLKNGRILIVGGWHPQAWGDSPLGDTTNEINYSDDNGKTWTNLLPDDRNPPVVGLGARFKAGHSSAVFNTTFNGVEYIYWIGTDANASTNRDGGVWRSSDGGLTWKRISNSAPTSDRSLFMWGVYNNAIYIMGGQNLLADVTSVNNEVYRSLDEGVSWQKLPNAPWLPRVGPSSTSLTYNGYLWVIGGAIYYPTQTGRTYFNDVWKFDGTTWTQVLADGHMQWSGRHYHGLAVYHSKMWIVNGYALNSLGNGENDVIYSDDGANWTKIQTNGSEQMPWQPTHAQATLSLKDGSGMINTSGIADQALWRMSEHSGALVSSWNDQGTSKLQVSQSISDQQFLLDPSAFNGTPGLLASNGQMSLPTYDRNVSGGVLEEWVVGKTDTTTVNGNVSTLVGSIGPDDFNEFGLQEDALFYVDRGTFKTLTQGSGFTDDKTRLFGVEHNGSSIALYDGLNLLGAPRTDASFDTTYIGWDTLGATYGRPNGSNFTYGAVVILKLSAPSSKEFRNKLYQWSHKWGTVE